MDKVPFIAQPFDPNESLADEAVGYTLAAAGFYFQFTQVWNTKLVPCVGRHACDSTGLLFTRALLRRASRCPSRSRW